MLMMDIIVKKMVELNVFIITSVKSHALFLSLFGPFSFWPFLFSGPSGTLLALQISLHAPSKTTAEALPLSELLI